MTVDIEALGGLNAMVHKSEPSIETSDSSIKLKNLPDRCIEEKSLSNLKTKASKKSNYILEKVDANMNTPLTETQSKADNIELGALIDSQIGNHQSEWKETPQKRKQLFEKFGIRTPSPLIKLAKVTVAFHLWAEYK